MKIWQGIRKNWHLLALFIGNHKNWALLQGIRKNWHLLALFIVLALIAVKGFGVLFSYIFGEDIYVFLKTMSSGQEKITRMNEVGASIIGYALAIAGVLVTMLIAFLGLRNSELQASEYIEEKIERAVALYVRLGTACANAFYLAYEAPSVEQIPSESLAENSLQLQEAMEFHRRMLEALDKIASVLEKMSENGIVKSLFPDMSNSDSYSKIIEIEQEKLIYFPLHPAFISKHKKIKYDEIQEFMKQDNAEKQIPEWENWATPDPDTEHLAMIKRQNYEGDEYTAEAFEELEAQYMEEREREQEILKKTVLELAKPECAKEKLFRSPATYSECAFRLRARMRSLKKADIRHFPSDYFLGSTDPYLLSDYFLDNIETHDGTPDDRRAARWLGYYMGFEVHCKADKETGELVSIVPYTVAPNENNTEVRSEYFGDPRWKGKYRKQPRDVFFYAHTGFALLHDLLCFIPTKEAFKAKAKRCYPNREAIIDRMPFDEKMMEVPPSLTNVLEKMMEVPPSLTNVPEKMMEVPPSLTNVPEKKKTREPLIGRFVDLGAIYAFSDKTTLMTANRWDFRKHFTAN